MEYEKNFFLEKLCLKKWATSFVPPTIGGGEKPKSETIYSQNNWIFYVANI
jgi:hypothetical protein